MPMTANGLAKLLEEMGELAQVAAKRLAYFHTSTHPDGAGDLDRRMEDEIADVIAACNFVCAQFALDGDAMFERTERKMRLFQKWHDDPDNGRDCFHAAPAPSAPADQPSPDKQGQQGEWKWVPVEPTEEMAYRGGEATAGRIEWDDAPDDAPDMLARAIYRSMLAASPAPTEEPRTDGGGVDRG